MRAPGFPLSVAVLACVAATAFAADPARASSSRAGSGAPRSRVGAAAPATPASRIGAGFV